MKRYLLTAVIIGFSLLAACKQNSGDASHDRDVQKGAEIKLPGDIKPGVETICIWDQAVLRSIPSREKGKFLASISLGETVIWLGESTIDSTDQNLEYHKIRLSDGKEGWTLAYSLVRGARAAAITQKSYVHQRPDMLTVTDKIFEPMDMIAISKIDSDWLEVVGNQRKKSGWIQNNGVSFQEADVAVAILATKALREADPDKRRQLLTGIAENPALSNSVFMAGLRAMLSPTPSLEEELEGLEPPIDSGEQYPDDPGN